MKANSVVRSYSGGLRVAHSNGTYKKTFYNSLRSYDREGFNDTFIRSRSVSGYRGKKDVFMNTQ